VPLTPRELGLLFEAAPQGVLVVDPPRVREANPALCALLGYSHRQIARVGLDELVEELDHAALHEAMVRGSGPSVAVPIRLIHRRGDSVPVQITARTDGGSWFLFVEQAAPGAFDEHTDDALRGHVRARTRRLEESRDRYRALVESLADGLVTLTPGRELLYLNRTFTEMLGSPARSSLVARPFLDLVVEADRHRVGAALERMEQGSVARFETTLNHRDGSPVAVLVAGRALPAGPEGEDRGVLLIITDFAERRDISERLAVAGKMEALSTLAGGIAHDFNNLLTGILGNASRVRLAPGVGPEVDEAARSIEDSAELAARLTERLLALVRGQAPNRRVLDLGQMVERTIGLLGKLIPDTIEVVTDFAPGLAPVLADESQLQQAILNLCINARDAMLEDAGRGTLTVSVSGGVVRKMCDDGSLAAESGVFLDVEDTGPGVPPEMRRRVFDPFFTTKGLGRGMGLGLATVYQLVEAHGGTVDVETAPGGGARFRVALPSAPDRVADPPSGPTPTLATPDSAQAATVLVAEDEDSIRNLIVQCLRKHGYTVFSAADGREALGVWEYQKHAIDLLFLDVRMPHLDGTELLRRAREDRPHVPAVFSSGFIPEEKESQDVFERVVYLPKPYRIPDLLACVETALSLSADGWEDITTMASDPTGEYKLPSDTTLEIETVPTGPGVSMDAAATIQGVEVLSPVGRRRHEIGPASSPGNAPEE